ncbi:S8 family serine peptidase [uncultured Pseudoalteromonas sp.]|uniref:S8 family serine peptidase n=1 Tax=uncultured Pseudoalteromonas sp. TaxID=114053 RepID=UPI00259299D2|nr:S8 family serine peptidase [uncultured Pseudoalteromonas sp.]
MQFKRSMLGAFITLAVTATSSVTANEISVNQSKLKTSGAPLNVKQKAGSYIVQLKGQTAIAHAQDIGELLPTNQLVSVAGNNYNALTPAMEAYTQTLKEQQERVAGSIGSINILHSFKHTYNGFTAKLTPGQVSQLQSHPDVVGVWEDRLEIINTANTPRFLGLTGPNGQHTMNIKGENIVIGVVDTGIWPEHPSFADDGSYSDPSSFGWQGTCDTTNDPEFVCNNKLIGARYFKDSFESTYPVQYELGEFDSPRDADGHGSHTAGTAGGNENVAASVGGINTGNVSGIAPRARIAAYKACWNSDYETPEGEKQAGCFYGDTMAAIDQAVFDGVDVINYSIGGSLTDLTIPSTAAMLSATQAGVFVAVSAGNSGPDAETVGTPAPWVTSVAASTYDGLVPVGGDALQVTSGALNGSELFSVPATFAPLADNLAGELALAEPVEACNDNPLTNAEALNGKIALIARGSRAFTEKVVNAQNAGATAVVIYTYVDTNPFAMGGEDPAVAIPSVMISFDDGQALTDSVNTVATTVVLSQETVSGEDVEVGNIMADFSSRGPNLNTYDIIKPDITAPGVKILAATTAAPLQGVHGNSFAYLQGTSMSSPHIAGMAALFKESNASWSPAQIKSALMTTARQNLTKEDGTTQADPYDFGSGHADPVSALDPGLLFDANIGDYLAFLCGQDKNDFVEARGTTCAELDDMGHSRDASQLNIPSIAIAELLGDETVFRTVSNATNVASSYTASIEAPEGFNVTVATFDSNGAETPSTTLDVEANGNASFGLTFAKTETSEINVWKFGSITWTDGAGHSVRLPLAIKAIPTVKIEVPKSISGEMKRGRYRFPVKMLYSGNTSFDFTGLVAPFGAAGNVEKDPAQSFEFLGAGTTYHGFTIPEGTKVARFSLRDALVSAEGADLDLYVFRCVEWSCTQVDASLNEGSNEDVILTNPEAADNGDAGDLYITFIHGYSTGEEPSTDYTMLGWIADQADSSTRVISSKRAISGRYNYTTIMANDLTPGMVYMGGITYYNAEGEAEGTSVLELVNP